MNAKERTTKCGPITSEMTWQEVLTEYRKLDNDNDAIMSLTTPERASIQFAMFAEHRNEIINSIPKGLSDREFKDQICFRTYGEHLPDDFFSSRTSNNDV